MSRSKAGKQNEGILTLRLYVSGAAPHSLRARSNLERICQQRFAGRHAIEIIDVLAEPQRALDDGILVTPTLVKAGPGARRVIIGNLEREDMVLAALEGDG